MHQQLYEHEHVPHFKMNGKQIDKMQTLFLECKLNYNEIKQLTNIIS